MNQAMAAAAAALAAPLPLLAPQGAYKLACSFLAPRAGRHYTLRSSTWSLTLSLSLPSTPFLQWG